MKTTMRSALVVAAVIVFATLITTARAGEIAPRQRIGVYDSRAVAYASFWAEDQQRHRNETMKAAKEAKAASDTKRFQELSRALKTEQERIHLQVFSTAPIDDVLAGMKDRLPEIQKRAGVSQLVSKWDTKTLTEHKGDTQIDVTDVLLREFKLTDKQSKIVADLVNKPPLPLEKAEKLSREGKL